MICVDNTSNMSVDRRCDRMWTGARLLTLAEGAGLAVVEDAAIGSAAGRIVFAGARAECPPGLDAAETIDCGGRLVTPGLIDCHTHLVHAGTRVDEIARRHAGESYESIPRAGGGIVSTVRATRAASHADLLSSARPRLDALLADGVTTVEIKSGYGLDLDTERRQLAVARGLADERAVGVVTTCLAAHAVPPEWTADRAGYVAHVADVILPAVARDGLADRVDAFCETVAFSVAEVERIFTAAQRLGLARTLHADQRTDGGGAALAARMGAQSADHLEYASADGLAAMAAAGTVAVLLPGAFYVLRESRRPPIDLCRRLGVRMAIATDLNPGTSPLLSVRLALNFAATLYGLTVEECLAGATREAARALGLDDDRGTIEPGKWCDLAVWDAVDPAELVHVIGGRPLASRVWRGRCT
jgi:imidazolonepropionase